MKELRSKIMAKVGDFEFIVTEGLADQKFTDDFAQFFRLVVIDDEDIDFLDSGFAHNLTNILLENIIDGDLQPIVMDFVIEKFHNYFRKEGTDVV